MPFFDGLNSVQSPGGHRTQRAWVGVGCMGNNREGKLRKTSKNSKKSKVLEGMVKRVSAQSKMRWKNPKIPKGNNTLQDALRPGGTTSKCISINMLQNAFKKGGFSRGFYTFLRMCRTVRRASFWRLQLCAVSWRSSYTRTMSLSWLRGGNNWMGTSRKTSKKQRKMRGFWKVDGGDANKVENPMGNRDEEWIRPAKHSTQWHAGMHENWLCQRVYQLM